MQSLLALIFVIGVCIFLYIKRKKIVFERILFPVFYFVMYRTKLGLKAMDWIAKRFGFLLRPFSYVAIGVGFLGMVVICVELVRTLLKTLLSAAAPAGVGIVQPFVPNVPGTVFVPFLYFIICIVLIAVIHEGSHGVMARAFGIKVKSSGFAFLSVFLPLIPAAFVEPDEKVMRKRPLRQQLAVFAAGPVSNIITAGLVLLCFALVLEPVVLSVADFEGIQVTGFPEGIESPAQAAGILPGDVIVAVDGKELEDLSNFSNFLAPHSPGETVEVKTTNATHYIVLASHPQNESKAFMGITPKPQVGPSQDFIDKYGVVASTFVLWFIGLLFWLYLLSMGIGLFNLLPLGPVDGGRMFYGALSHFCTEKTATKIFGYTSTIVLGLILATIGTVIFL